jgi:hypothetical protein
MTFYGKVYIIGSEYFLQLACHLMIERVKGGWRDLETFHILSRLT